MNYLPKELKSIIPNYYDTDVQDYGCFPKSSTKILAAMVTFSILMSFISLCDLCVRVCAWLSLRWTG